MDTGRIFDSPLSPPTPPNIIPWPVRPAGGRPPLDTGCGIGEGEVAGEVIRGLLIGVDRLAVCGWCGTLFEIAGDPLAEIDPKVILVGALLFEVTGPPLGML